MDGPTISGVGGDDSLEDACPKEYDRRPDYMRRRVLSVWQQYSTSTPTGYAILPLRSPKGKRQIRS